MKDIDKECEQFFEAMRPARVALVIQLPTSLHIDSARLQITIFAWSGVILQKYKCRQYVQQVS